MNISLFIYSYISYITSFILRKKIRIRKSRIFRFGIRRFAIRGVGIRRFRIRRFVDSGFVNAGYSFMLASDELIKIDRVSLVKISCENVGGSCSINIYI